MNLHEIAQHISDSPARDFAVKAAGWVGGSTFVSGFVFDPTWLTAAGQFMGGLAALLTIIYTIWTKKVDKS